jgi:GTP-binding protein Era
VPVSALRSDGTDLVLDELGDLLEPGPAFFPPDVRTDQPDQLFAAELVREKYLSRLRDELPHALAVIVEEVTTRPDGVVHVPATVYVERNSQKGMVIGKGGSVLREVGSEARLDLERLFGAKVYLELRVKVEKDWQRRESSLDRMGF